MTIDELDELIEAYIERYSEKQEDFNVVEKLGEVINLLKEIKNDLNDNPS